MPKRAAQPTGRILSQWLDRFTGKSEEEVARRDFARGIKERREPSAEAGDYFFDPTTTEISAPAALMTRYINKTTGVPEKSIREMGTRAFQLFAEQLSPEIRQHALEFAKRFPRIAAHMKPEEVPMSIRPQSRGFTYLGGRDPDLRTMNPVKLKKEFTPREIRNTVFHEGTHVAQDLGLGKDVVPLKEAVDEAMLELFKGDAAKAYKHNPFEGGAVVASLRKTGELKDVPEFLGAAGLRGELVGKKFTTMRRIKDVIGALPPTSPARIKIEEILKQRRELPFKPPMR